MLLTGSVFFMVWILKCLKTVLQWGFQISIFVSGCLECWTTNVDCTSVGHIDLACTFLIPKQTQWLMQNTGAWLDQMSQWLLSDSSAPICVFLWLEPELVPRMPGPVVELVDCLDKSSCMSQRFPVNGYCSLGRGFLPDYINQLLHWQSHPAFGCTLA